MVIEILISECLYSASQTRITQVAGTDASAQSGQKNSTFIGQLLKQVAFTWHLKIR
jgi:hypothetical protein